jgi:hypothetical protein
MTTPSGPADDTPSSPTLVKHTTTNATPKHPFIDTTVASINTAPIELDSTPVSPVARKESWKIRGAPAGVGSTMVSPDMEEEEVYGELSGVKGGNEVEREVYCPTGAFSESSANSTAWDRNESSFSLRGAEIPPCL